MLVNNEDLSNYDVFVPHLRAAIIVHRVTLQVPVMLQVSGVIQFTFMCSHVRIFIFNVKTDTVVILITKALTVVQVLHLYGSNLVVRETSFSEEIVSREVQFAISIWNKLCTSSC